MTVVDDYFRLVDEVHDHFGYVEDYALFSMQDRRDVFWEIVDSNKVMFADTEDALLIGLSWDGAIFDIELEARADRSRRRGGEGAVSDHRTLIGRLDRASEEPLEIFEDLIAFARQIDDDGCVLCEFDGEGHRDCCPIKRAERCLGVSS